MKPSAVLGVYALLLEVTVWLVEDIAYRLDRSGL